MFGESVGGEGMNIYTARDSWVQHCYDFIHSRAMEENQSPTGSIKNDWSGRGADALYVHINSISFPVCFVPIFHV